jgi:hypothetical protein
MTHISLSPRSRRPILALDELAPRGVEEWPILPVLALFSAGWLAFAWPWLSGSVTIPWDAKAHFAPQIQFMAQAIARGESPFWLPYAFSGVPQIADPQSMLFSPPFLALALVNGNPTLHAIDVTIMLALLMVGWSVIWLARDLGWHWAAAAVAALAFCFGASMAWRLQHFGQVLSLGYLPFAVLAVRRAMLRGSVIWGALAGLAGAMIVLGRDQVGLLSVYVLSAYTLWLIVADDAPWPRARRSLAPLVAAAIVGLAIVALPLLMTWLYAAQSNRPAIDFAGAGRGSLHPALGVTALVPHLFGAAGEMAAYWGPPSLIWQGTDLFIAQNMGLLYVSVPVLMLLITGLVRGVLFEREAAFFTLALALVTLYALGRYTPVFGHCYDLLPGVALYRRPADATFLIGAFAALCSGHVVHRWLTNSLPPAAAWQRLAEISVPLAILALGVGFAWYFDRLELARRPLAFAMIWMGLAVLVLAMVDHVRMIRPLASGLVLTGLVAADLVLNNGPNGATALPPAAIDMLEPTSRSPTLALLKSKVKATTTETKRPRVELTGLGFHWPNASLTHRLDNVVGYNPVRPRRYAEAVGAGDSSGNADQRAFPPLFPSYRSTMANLLGLRYIATGIPIEQIDKRLSPGDLPLLAKTADGYVYENQAALPRVLFAHFAQKVEVAAAMRTGELPPVDFRTTVLLENPPGERERRPGRARITSYRTTEVVVEADSPDGGWIVLADPWHPWWRVTIGDVPGVILEANVLFRAVEVPSGRHTIRFSFEPVSGVIAEFRDRIGKPR